METRGTPMTMEIHYWDDANGITWMEYGKLSIRYGGQSLGYESMHEIVWVSFSEGNHDFFHSIQWFING